MTHYNIPEVGKYVSLDDENGTTFYNTENNPSSFNLGLIPGYYDRHRDGCLTFHLIRPISSDKNLDLIDYDTLKNLLKEKWDATHEEIDYWIHKRIFIPYLSDIKMKGEFERRFERRVVPISYLDVGYGADFYMVVSEKFINPPYHFYERKSVEDFIPNPMHRFVYINDLFPKRKWTTTHEERSNVLLSANRKGILRFWDEKMKEFTLYKKQSNRDILWADTQEGEEYVSFDFNFFLKVDILNIERIFFNKDLSECQKELYPNQ